MPAILIKIFNLSAKIDSILSSFPLISSKKLIIVVQTSLRISQRTMQSFQVNIKDDLLQKLKQMNPLQSEKDKYKPAMKAF